MAQRIEQGSVLGFVLVGAVLLGLLAGGIYIVRHMQSTDNTTTTKPATPSKDNNGADNGSSAPAKPSTSNEDQLKAALDAQSKSKEEAKNSDASASSTSSTNATGSSSSSAAALPKTGPEQVIGPMLGAALLMASGVSYVRSRRLI